jgi:hypothetical protein
MLSKLLSWFRSPSTVSAAMQSRPSGRLTHKKIYTFGVTPSGKHCTSCPLCRESGHHVFSIAVDESGKQHRCCLRCLGRLGGDEQVKLAAKRSRYARRVIECIEAMDALRAAFPDPARRPYGEKALLAEIELPFMGYDGIERVLAKITSQNWTEYDKARIEGRPEPPSR